ncbi:MAG: pyrophosphate--fructose-6-phosphate 1-phosphotransferase [Candidatus Didemnitutus sp.]|nr:pyrophosphate--fructose-6-phosphate 1-phosphotransferase [Candidatus Didemnitutus sp.]
MKPRKVAILTAGGLAPCLSAAVGELISQYTDISPDTELICYRSGYKGLLLGDSIAVTPDMRGQAGVLRRYGGSPIGNSRVRLTNIEDCVKRGLVKAGQDPQAVAARQLKKDKVDVLHTIGGDDTNIAAADLATYLKRHGYHLTVIGLPKTIDNDIIPLRQSLGAWTAAEQGAKFFQNVVSEHGASSRMLLVHEVMGRHSGWLTAATTRDYLRFVDNGLFVPGLGHHEERWSVHGVYLPEMELDLAAEGDRLRRMMDQLGNINLFVSEGACVDSVIAEMTARGEPVERDPFGHVKLDQINVGAWFGQRFASLVGAEKVLVQKSGYFARSAPANEADLVLIGRCVEHAIECALRGESGLIGEDEAASGRLRPIEFSRVKGGKEFDLRTRWFKEIMVRTGQKAARKKKATLSV